MNEKLIDAVKEQIGGSNGYIMQILHDVCEHGANDGVSGFTYYCDTVEFFDHNKAGIMDLAEGIAEELGIDMLVMIADFSCLRDNDYTPNDVAKAIYGVDNDDAMLIKNALAWFALEEVARFVCDR